MKRRVSVQRLGLVSGRFSRIVHYLRRNFAEVGQPDEFWWGDDKVVLDFERLPARVARAVPCGYATPNVKPEDWEPFVQAAILRGLL